MFKDFENIPVITDTFIRKNKVWVKNILTYSRINTGMSSLALNLFFSLHDGISSNSVCVTGFKICDVTVDVALLNFFSRFQQEHV